VTAERITGLVTIGVPVFNGSNYIASALSSLGTQTYEQLEIIVADNASTDDTVNIVNQIAADDPRVRLLPADENLGAAWNYNRLVEAATGEYFRWAAHDDLLEPTNVESCVKVLDERPEVVLAYPQTMIIDGASKAVKPYDENMAIDFEGDVRRAATLLWRIGLCNAVFGVIRTDELAKTPLIQAFDSSDIALLAELALRGRFAQVEGRTFLRRRHESGSRMANTDTSAVAAWFAPDAASGRSRALIRSYLRSARSWGPNTGSAISASAMFATVGPLSELKWHRRVRRRRKRAAAASS
jgi:glycosyltransferase involved in cell wall biosynthesis